MKLLERDNSAFFVVFSPLECVAGSFFVRELIMGGCCWMLILDVRTVALEQHKLKNFDENSLDATGTPQ